MTLLPRLLSGVADRDVAENRRLGIAPFAHVGDDGTGDDSDQSADAAGGKEALPVE